MRNNKLEPRMAIMAREVWWPRSGIYGTIDSRLKESPNTSRNTLNNFQYILAYSLVPSVHISYCNIIFYILVVCISEIAFEPIVCVLLRLDGFNFVLFEIDFYFNLLVTCIPHIFHRICLNPATS